MSPLHTSLHDVIPFQLRGLAFTALSETGHVHALTYVDNQGGGQAGSWTAGTAVPCRVDPMGGGEDVVADRLDERTTHLIYVPPGTQARARDRFSATAGTYEITAVRTRTQEQVRVLEATEDF